MGAGISPLHDNLKLQRSKDPIRACAGPLGALTTPAATTHSRAQVHPRAISSVAGALPGREPQETHKGILHDYTAACHLFETKVFKSGHVVDACWREDSVARRREFPYQHESPRLKALRVLNLLARARPIFLVIHVHHQLERVELSCHHEIRSLQKGQAILRKHALPGIISGECGCAGRIQIAQAYVRIAVHSLSLEAQAVIGPIQRISVNPGRRVQEAHQVNISSGGVKHGLDMV
mmetsp:Transcript_37885/g.82621  ORF Transcript_37885/g.82621 Transcript_37885/m.82621 type:complete len:236 (-) Transcript_37885:591-1298(-)